MYILYLLIDVLSQGIWSELADLKDPELKELAKSLPATVLRGRAPSTVKKYSSAFLRWKKWAESKQEVSVVPARPIHVALYMSFLTQKSYTSAPVQEAVNAISWAHQIAVLEDPTMHPLVRNVLAGSKRILAHQTKKKEPITPEILESLVTRFATTKASLNDIRSLTICLVGFAGFLRFDELSKIKETDVTIFDQHMEIFLETSKTDQYRDGARIVIARTSSNLCRVAMMERYLALIQTGQTCPDKHLFGGLIKTKAGYRLRDSGNISYTRVREIVLEMLEAIGLDKKKFGLHSLRSGGASAAANAGVPDRCFKRHGRLKSENAKDGYIKDTLKERLSVSKSIGL